MLAAMRAIAPQRVVVGRKRKLEMRWNKVRSATQGPSEEGQAFELRSPLARTSQSLVELGLVVLRRRCRHASCPVSIEKARLAHVP